MNLRRTTVAALLGTLTMATLLPLAAQAAAPRAPHPGVQTVQAVPSAQTAQAPQADKPAPRRARASLSVRAARPAPWVGQTVPVTITAIFRDVEGVTLEGPPVLASKAIVTSEIAKEPRQSTQIIDGERVLVASWPATVTPSSAGPLDLTAELPVRLRYRQAAPRVERAFPQGDPFSDLGDGDLGQGDPFQAMFRHMQQRMLQATEESAGTVREEAIELKATTPPLDVRALPAANRPASFTGAVGKFDIDASVPTAKVSVSDPVTLRITVSGDVDLDRVDLGGVASSASWKTYPPRVIAEAAAADAGKTPAKASRKIFEQVIVPLHGGALTVPEVSFTSFDPTSGTYLTRSTRPLVVSVDGAADPSVNEAPSPASASTTNSTNTTATNAATAPSAAPDGILPAPPRAAPVGPVRLVDPWHVAFGVLPVLLLVLGALAYRVVARKRSGWALRRSMRRAATAGDVEPFLGSAHRLIAARLAERWGVAPDEVTPSRVRERLGPEGEPLVDVLVADAALRFGRGGLDGTQLGLLCKSVERSLRGAA